MKTMVKLWIGLLILILLSPLGLILPAKFGAGSAWGEWSSDELQKLVGYVPSGMSRTVDSWKAPMPDYAMKGQENASLHKLSFSYILSGLLGAAVVVGVTILIGRMVAKNDEPDDS